MKLFLTGVEGFIGSAVIHNIIINNEDGDARYTLE